MKRKNLYSLMYTNKQVITMKLRVTIAILFILVALPIVLAQDVRFVGKEGSNLDIREPCFNNGTYCSSSAVCNITVWMPNNAILISDQTMTNNGAYHNYTLNTTQTDLVGDYESSIMCCDGDECNFDTFLFKVTPSGHLYNDSEAMIYGIILVGLLVFIIFFLLVMKSTEAVGVKLFFLLISFVLVVLAAGIIRIFLDYTSLSGGIVNIITVILVVIVIVFITTMYYVFVNQTRHALQMIKMKKGFGDVEKPQIF